MLVNDPSCGFRATAPLADRGAAIRQLLACARVARKGPVGHQSQFYGAGIKRFQGAVSPSNEFYERKNPVWWPSRMRDLAGLWGRRGCCACPQQKIQMRKAPTFSPDFNGIQCLSKHSYTAPASLAPRGDVLCAKLAPGSRRHSTKPGIQSLTETANGTLAGEGSTIHNFIISWQLLHYCFLRMEGIWWSLPGRVGRPGAELRLGFTHLAMQKSSVSHAPATRSKPVCAQWPSQTPYNYLYSVK